MNVLVTGGIGFVGMNVVRYLAETLPAGTVFAADVLPYDRAAVGFLAPVAERIRYMSLDVTDRSAVRRAIAQADITHVVHAAAITPSNEREQQQPTPIVDVNLIGAINVLDGAIQAAQLERVLLLSSSGLYGAPASVPLQPQHEDDALQLDNLYSITKYSVELLGRRYAQLSGKLVASARLAAPYGPMERPTGSRERMGQLQQLAHAFHTQQAVTVAGPEVVRDWTYIADTAEAVRALLVAPTWTQPVYNVSSGAAVTFEAVVAAFVAHGLRATWTKMAADIAMRPDQTRAPLDIGRLQADTGFRPRYHLAQGIAAYLEQGRPS